MRFIVFIVVASVVGSFARKLEFKERPECDQWAGEGECVNNPGFMWSSCHISCIEQAKDLDECPQWASEGECTNNPSFIQINCPKACNYAVSWSPWARRNAGINDALPLEQSILDEIISCNTPVDILGAANVIRKQVNLFLEGGASMTPGLTTTAPSEYLGMLGIVEAIFYSFRLYDINHGNTVEALSLQITSRNNPHYLATTINNAKEQHAKILEIFHQMSTVISSTWSSDVLLQNIPKWAASLNEAEAQATSFLDLYTKVVPVYAKYSEIIKNPCPAPRGPDMNQILQSFSDLTHQAVPVAKEIRLSDGRMLPLVGLGTWQLEGAICETTVIEAIRLGYRHIDTAEAYRNEASIGWGIYHAINRGYAVREELFIATKLSDETHGGAQTFQQVQQQLDLLRVEYIDLYMLHSPMRSKPLQRDTWFALEQLVKQGKIKSLGVSNFGGAELQELLSYADIKPVVVQNKMDIYHLGKQVDPSGDNILSVCASNNIVPVAYSPFSAYPFVMMPTEDPIVKFVAAERGNTPGQVILRYLLENGAAVIPRSSNLERLSENLVVPTLPPLSPYHSKLLSAVQLLAQTPVTRAVPFPNLSR